MALLYLSTPERGAIWASVFAEAGEQIVMGEDAVRDPARITHIACWTPPADLGRYPSLRAVISMGAGVDHLPPLPEGVALVRTIAPGVDAMVRDWIVMATLMMHRDVPLYLDQARSSCWKPWPAAATRQRRVGVMGLGRIGRLAAASLAALGFPVSGLNRSGDAVAGVQTFGPQSRDAFLAASDILVCVLPLTTETRGVLNGELFSRLPAGARLVHAGRGAQLDLAALMAALDAGRLAAAMLDVTHPEPLPRDHPAWRHPRIVITPHVAGQSDAREGALHALAVIHADRVGDAVPGLVSTEAGY
jgi:glyoxylate/hydroxypyruvate reductase